METWDYKQIITKRNLTIAGAVCLIILFVVLLTVLTQKKEAEKIEEEILTAKQTGKTTMVYGIDMHSQCYEEFQNFVDNYGADYSKCLMDVDLSTERCGGFDPNTQGMSDINVMVILDSSGSMAEEIGADEKIEIAKEAVSDFMIDVPEGVKTGLIVYGHKGSNSTVNKNLSCAGIEEIIKLGENNSSNIVSAMDAFTPKGWTPIAGSIDFAKNIFINSGKNNNNYLILLSDGIESCDGDPVTAARNLKSEVSDVKLNVIGLGGTREMQEFLKKIAAAGNGSYLSASNLWGLANALNNQLLAIKKDCINGIILRINSKNQTNNLNNLNCWLAATKRETEDFTVNVTNKPNDLGCESEVTAAVQARQEDFWNKKEEIVKKNNAIYEAAVADSKIKLKELEKSAY